MDQGEVTDGSVIAPSRGWLSPARALLLILGAVLGGVVLSLALGSSPAHAADGDGAPVPPNPLTAATRSVAGAVVSAVSAGTGASIPAVEQTIQQTMDASAATVVTAVPVIAPVVAPAVTSVEATLADTLTATAWTVQQLTAPAASALDPFALVGPAAGTSQAAGSGAAMHPHTDLRGGLGGSAISGDLPAAQGGSAADGALPGPLVSSASSASPAAVGVLLAAFALVLLAARRRVIQNTVPSSPVFDTDTSPA